MKTWTTYIAGAAIVAAFAFSGCVPTETSTEGVVVELNSAENSFYTNDGRLFITGLNGLNEVTGSGSSHQAVRITGPATTCNGKGIAQLGNWVVYVCYSSRQVWGYNLVENSGASVQFGTLTGVGSLNGMAALDSNTLFIADFTSTGAVIRVTIDFSGATPQIASVTPDWIGSAFGISKPNGLRFSGNSLFLNSKNKELYRVDLDASGVATAATRLTDSDSAGYDDIWPLADGVLATGYTEGAIYYVGNNCYAKSAAVTLTNPSSIRPGQGEFEGKFLITDRIADKLVAIPASEIPTSCQ